MKDANVMYRRLFSLAFKRFGCDRDDAHDVASYAICEMIQEGTDDFNYGFTVAKNKALRNVRTRKRHRTGQFPVDGDGEPVELNLDSGIASADLSLIASECLTAIENLPDSTRHVMRLVALGYEPDEIASELLMPKKDVYWRTQHGRNLLRQRAGYELERKRGHYKFIGIRKDHNRWSASLRSGDDYHHLGYFGTASEAAKAYDAKAKEIHGDKAKLNFAI